MFKSKIVPLPISETAVKNNNVFLIIFNKKILIIFEQEVAFWTSL